ncbi:MAG: hypothetical protein HRT88_00580 [Lentisphaeraceae bacterium]|nr:hypothetical protein [Lentisphaeraceae bacterium]
MIFQCLSANIALNDLTNVWAYQYGLADKPAVMHLPTIDYNSTHNFASVSLTANNEGEEVRVVRLEELDPGPCCLIKINVEDIETEVLQRAVGLINNYKPVLYTVNNNNEKSTAHIKFTENMGYKVYCQLSPSYNQNNFNGKKENIFGNLVDMNILCTATPVNASSNCFFPASPELNIPEKAFQTFIAPYKFDTSQ